MKMRVFLLTLLSVCSLYSQTSRFKPQPTFHTTPSYVTSHALNKPSYLPRLESPFIQTSPFVVKPFLGASLDDILKVYKVLELDGSGHPTRMLFPEAGLQSRSRTKTDWSKQLKLAFDPEDIGGIEFKLREEQTDDLGIQHLKFDLLFDGYPVFGSEYFVHVYPGKPTLAHGNFKQPDQANTASISSEEAYKKAVDYLNTRGIACASPRDNQPSFVKLGLQQHTLGYLQDPADGSWKLVYELEIFPDLMKRWIVYVDAVGGNIVKAHAAQCMLHVSEPGHVCTAAPNPSGSETTTAKDLFDVTRTLNVWREGSFVYMIDAARPMFKPSSFKLDDPVGVIWTIDGLNSTVDNPRVDQIRSSSNTWSKTAVSAHYNGSIAYEYYLNTHSRNSIDGNGGTIISIINITDQGGTGLDNAFWNGQAMFYGNGAQAFGPLAKGLDVAGHEMSHGVIQNTANLAYEGESGAINESFADVFGAMIDRNDWKIGEDVVKLSSFPSGALRDLSDPHNGGQTNDFSRWQPKHVSEQYKGSQDNGGVHINSGIPNYAFFLFVQEIAKSSNEEQAKQIGEKVYYRTLANYLTRSSQFKDLRLAVEQACIDLHGNNSTVHNAAKKAFDLVGIGSSGNPGGGGTQYQKDLPVNPGNEYVICTDVDDVGVYLINLKTNKIIQLTARAIKSKPSVTDNGVEIYYVGMDSKLYGLFLNQSTKVYEEFVLDPDPIYRNAVISKDGRLLSVLFQQEENKIHIFDFVKQVWKTYTLTNPTTSSGVVTSNVRYADFMDFEPSGQYVMYDALSKLERTTGGNYEYWDIGFIRVWDRGTNVFGDGHIEKLFSDIPENTSVGNPVFSKNSPYIIAFDYLEEGLFSNTFSIVGANIETGALGEIAGNRDDTGYPNYSVNDQFIIYDGVDNSGKRSIKFKELNKNKIQSAGSEQLFISEAHWGNWFADGKRVLIKTQQGSGSQAIVAYPNPFDQSITLSIERNEPGELLATLRNQMGQEMFQKGYELFSGKQQIILDNIHVAPGLYYLELNISGNRMVIPVVKAAE